MSAAILDSLVTKQAELSGIVAKIAAEGRSATEEETSRLTALKTDIDGIRKSWEDTGRRAFLSSVQPTAPSNQVPVLTKEQTFADHFKSTYAPGDEGLNLGRLVKGIATGDWGGAEFERKAAMSEVTASGGGFLVPGVLSNRLIDLARNKSVLVAAGAGTVPMSSQTLDMARVQSDPSAAWYPENGTIGETDMTFGRMQFSAKKLACVARISNELLADAANVQTIVESAIAAAMALEIDRTGLLGTGVGQPLGILNTSGINTVTGVGNITDFDDFLTAIYDIIGYNFNANAAIYSPRTAKTLARLSSGIINATEFIYPVPDDFKALAKFITNQIPNTLGGGGNESIAVVGEFSHYLFALRSDIRLEISREADTAFMKDQTLIRAIWRGDGQVDQPRAFSVLSGITA